MKHLGKSRGHMQPRKQSQRRPVSLVKQQPIDRDQNHSNRHKSKSA